MKVPEMQPRANVWLEREGKVALSIWRVELLKAIAETGSITAAAAKMNIPYRRAWDKIHECEERLGIKLVETQVGGVDGGGSQLTPEAKDYINRFQEFTAGLQSLLRQRFQETFQEHPST